MQTQNQAQSQQGQNQGVMASLSSKNMTILDDQMSKEALNFKKMNLYAGYCNDQQLKSLCGKAAQMHKKHFDTLILKGKSEKAAKSQAEKMAAEDARYVLPNACETKLIATFNARSLYNFLTRRLCERAQWEIMDLAQKMYELVIDVAPTLFKKAGPPCVYGPCTEGKMSCGKIAEKRKMYRSE